MAGMIIKSNKISLIRTLFIAVNSLSAIRLRQNLNWKVRLKLLKLFESSILLLLFQNITKNLSSWDHWVSTVSTCFVYKYDRYFSRKGSIFWKNDIIFNGFWWFIIDFSQIKTNSWISTNFLKYWILTKSDEIKKNF